MSLYRNPDPPAESFWVVVAAIWLPLLGLIAWAGDAVPVGKLLLLGLAFNAAVLLGLAYLRPEARPDLAERRRMAFWGFQWVVDACAGISCVVIAMAVAIRLLSVLPREGRQTWWIQEFFALRLGPALPSRPGLDRAAAARRPGPLCETPRRPRLSFSDAGAPFLSFLSVEVGL